VTPPARLMERPYLQPVYDEPSSSSGRCGALRGWWDGNPATSSRPRSGPLPGLADLAGGPGCWPTGPGPPGRSRSRAGPKPEPEPTGIREGPATPRTTPTDRRCGWPGTWRAGLVGRSEDPGVRAVRRQVFSRRAQAASSTMATGCSRGRTESGEAPETSLPERLPTPRNTTRLNWEFVPPQAGRLSTSNSAPCP